MNSERFTAHCEAIPLTRLEKVYALLAPLGFRAAEGWEQIRGATADDLASRRGLVPYAGESTVWFHGASAGEMSAAIAFDELLRERGFKFSPVYTTTNRAGIEYVRKSKPVQKAIVLAPWDTPGALEFAFDRWRPRLLFLFETELWPRMIYEASIRNIPAFCLSARIYERDVKRYAAIKRFFLPTLRRLTLIATQDAIERQRFNKIAGEEVACVTAGNLKYLKQSEPPDGLELAAECGIAATQPVIVAGSLHQDEVRDVLTALRPLHRPGLRIVVAPRHLSATELIKTEASALGWNVAVRSRMTSRQWDLLVVDSIGELKRFYSLATCAIVGGGFARHGGHNPFEPVMMGSPAVFGVNFENFSTEARLLGAATPEALVTSMDDLRETIKRWLENESHRATIRRLQRATIPDGNAIADRYLEALAPWLSAIHA